jgi:aminodeoxyfutalosine deaminase
VRTYLLISSTLQRAEDFALIVADFAAEMARQHIRYAEVTFTPMTHVNRGVPWEALRDGLDAGRAAARSDHASNRLGDASCARCLSGRALPLALAGMDHGVIGLSLGGPGRPPAGAWGVFARARDRAALRAAAGRSPGRRACGARCAPLGASASATTCAASRTRPARHLREHQIPSRSTHQQSVPGRVPGHGRHPIRSFWHNGQYVTVNSDDRRCSTPTSTALSTSWPPVGGRRTRQLSLKALHASFLPPQRKAELEHEFRAEFARLRTER